MSVAIILRRQYRKLGCRDLGLDLGGAGGRVERVKMTKIRRMKFSNNEKTF